MSLRMLADDAAVFSPCHERYNCPHQAEDKDYCSHECREIAMYRKFLDGLVTTGLGQIDYEDTYEVKVPEVQIDFEFIDRDNFIEPTVWA